MIKIIYIKGNILKIYNIYNEYILKMMKCLQVNNFTVQTLKILYSASVLIFLPIINILCKMHLQHGEKNKMLVMK